MHYDYTTYSIESKFPSWFELNALTGNRQFKKVNMTDGDGWKVIYFYPKDFTFVCPTEIVDFDNLMAEFCKLNATVYGVSPDNEYCKLAWRDSHPQLTELNHTLVADCGAELARELGILSCESVPYRVTYILDGQNEIKYIGMHGLSVGRSAAEVLRVLDACQKGDEGMLCPASRPVGGATL